MHVFIKWMMFLVFSMALPAYAEGVHGILRVVKGDVKIKSAKAGAEVRARIGEKVFPKDVIVTGKDARAKIVMVDNNEINVSPESQIEIQNYEYDPAAGKKEVLLNVIYGKVRSKVEQKYDGKTSKFQIKTPSAVAGVRGTDFLTSYTPSNNQSQIVTFQGKVEFGLPGPNGSIMNPVFVTPGTQASALGSAAPTPPTPVSKSELAKMDNESRGQDRSPSSGGGSGMIQKQDVPGNPSAPKAPGGSQILNGPPGPPPPPPTPPAQQNNPYVQDAVQSGKTKLIIRVNGQ